MMHNYYIFSLKYVRIMKFGFEFKIYSNVYQAL